MLTAGPGRKERREGAAGAVRSGCTAARTGEDGGAAEGWLPAPQPPRPVASSEGCEFAEDLPDDVEMCLLWAFHGVDVEVLFPEAAQRAPEVRHGVAAAVELAHDDGELGDEDGEGGDDGGTGRRR